MTKVIIIGEQEPKKELKPIEFISFINFIGQIETLKPSYKPIQYNYIELICKDYQFSNNEKYDLMFAYRDKEIRSDGIIYIGHFNDGVVE